MPVHTDWAARAGGGTAPLPPRRDLTALDVCLLKQTA